jgi:2',3'-cyclic-nucleotide 2'-phosphodiesterase (5'-nucleotidase family)
MRESAVARGVDLLLIDTGDLSGGTGLSDGGPPGSANAHFSNEFFAQLPYDLLTIGK